MRRLLSSVALSALLAGGARAQEVSGSEGSLFLLLPTGAQAVGMGQAMVAATPGSEGIWWNPASIAGEKKRELAIHHSTTVAGVGDALTFVTPIRSYGTLGASINILNIGEQDVTDGSGQVIGHILPRDVVFAASFATDITKRLTAGLNYKLIQLRVDCSGQCSSVGAEVKSSRAPDTRRRDTESWRKAQLERNQSTGSLTNPARARGNLPAQVYRPICEGHRAPGIGKLRRYALVRRKVGALRG